ncbi:Hybrid signal transduction histidine kinase K [Drechslerella dactyloides]|uniref:Hybrid signal transduction histidine kinase K n=1 Tax=Drechslerella dactyloides TaxID=74499 RepID=A0AAD6J2K9_DREDA|nr:Hybrid signal transduction histidine kinase K [Drechslerella dactyloides]
MDAESLPARLLSYSSISTGLSSRNSSSDANVNINSTSTSTATIPLLQSLDGHGSSLNGTADDAAGRTRKLSVVSFTSTEYNRNDEDCGHSHDGDDRKGGSPRAHHRRRHEQLDIAEEPSRSPSPALSTGCSSSSSSSFDGRCHSTANPHNSSDPKKPNNNNTNIKNASRAKRRRRQRRHQARDFTTLSTKPSEPVGVASSPASFCYGPPADDWSQIDSSNVRPSSDNYTVDGGNSLQAGLLSRHCYCRSPSPSNPTSWDSTSASPTTATTATARAFPESNHHADIVSPNGFHPHSLSASSGHHHPDHHLHKRRRRIEAELPRIHYLTSTPPPPAVPTSVVVAPTSTPKDHYQPYDPPVADLISVVSPEGRSYPIGPEDLLVQPVPTRPAQSKGRSLSTPAGGVGELFSPLHSLNTSPTRPNFFTDSIRDLWNRQHIESCQVYDMAVTPGVKTFSVPVSSRNSTTSAASKMPPQLPNSLAVPFRDSPPAGLPDVHLLEVLHHDPRPTFILGTGSSITSKNSLLSSTTIHNLQLEVVYHNEAFSSILPDAAFSTTTIEPGHQRTMFNITDPRYHRWISSSFTNTKVKNAKCRPYVCPDGILWTQNAFTCADGARMVLICGVPLPSTNTNEVHVKKGDTCRPHVWEEATETTRARASLDQDDGTTLTNDPEIHSIGIMGQLDERLQALPNGVNHGMDISKGDQIPRLRSDSSILAPIIDSNSWAQFSNELDPDVVISPSSAPMPIPQTTFSQNLENEAGPSEAQCNGQLEGQMDISDNAAVVERPMGSSSRNSTVYSPHLPSDYGVFYRTPFGALDPHTELVRRLNWAATGFGAIETWPQSLRTMINLVLSSPHPTAMYWGPEFSVIYNESYVPLLGAKHPKLLGQKYKDGWPEIWDAIGPFLNKAVRTGKSTIKEDDRLYILRNGFREETYFSWSISPIIGEDGSIIGLLSPAFEKTRRIIAERRMLTLREVGERCGSARDVREFWNHVLAALETNPWDAPFAILYSCCKKTDSADSEVSSAYASSLSNARVYSLECAIGVPDGHPAAPQTLDLKSNAGSGFSVAFREALNIGGNIFLSQEAGTLPADLMEGIEVQGFSDDACTAAVVCPINPNPETPLGFLILGINPRRPFDDEYRLFIQLLTRQLTTSVASVVLHEEEVHKARRAARLAALDRVELSKQLAMKAKEVEHSELKFTRLVDFAPVGIFIADLHGEIEYHNGMFSEISAHPRSKDASRWLESVHPADAARTEANWLGVIQGKKRMTWEFRWKEPWRLPSHPDGQVDRWTLLSASPELDSDGFLLGVFGSITNISETKFAEDMQKRRVEEVVELKRQQDNFVDMASHEMRNPLSAILQGADAMLESLERYRNTTTSKVLLDDIESSIDVAQTISLCALHQKRVVDDILTMSKLDSALLTVTPVDVQPIAVVERAFKIFEQEAISSDTKMTFKIDESYKRLAIDWVKLDPARLLQVLINLLTNALKFLRTESSKSIIVTIGGSLEQPAATDEEKSLVFFSSSRNVVDLTNDPDWGDGEPVFLTFSVLDTGKGLTEVEKRNLFQKFSQATAKTEVSYGGSGLGLFICKELVHLQSGEIGVQSEAGKGCNFSFYIKSRRSTRPEVEIPQASVLRSAGPGNPKKRDANNQSAPMLTYPSAGPAKSEKRAAKLALRNASDKPKLNYNVLIVEDNLVNQKLLRKALESAGCTTYLANHGVEALERIKKTVHWKDAKADAQDLSLVLMDVEMPVMDGLTCKFGRLNLPYSRLFSDKDCTNASSLRAGSKRIREMQADGLVLKHIPIIAVTANARQAQIDKMFEAGMDDVVSKPYRIADLIPKLHAVVTKYQDAGAGAAAGYDRE